VDTTTQELTATVARPVRVEPPVWHGPFVVAGPADTPQTTTTPAPTVRTAAGGLGAWRGAALWLVACVATVASAIGAKELGGDTPLVAWSEGGGAAFAAGADPADPVATPAIERAATAGDASAPTGSAAGDAPESDRAAAGTTGVAGDGEQVRWFNGRPIRPARTLMMRVTAYSPHEASCYPFADGQTATLHSVSTNGGFLVAADTDVLPFGSMLSVPGYNRGRVVPVLDRGGAIRGNRLDVLFPTHEAALAWGVRDLAVVVWEYADGKPAPDPRELR